MMRAQARRARRPARILLPVLLAFAAAAPAARSEPPELDPVYFEDIVLPFLRAQCATSGCHGAPGAGRLLIEPVGLSDRSGRSLRRLLERVEALVVPGAPKESRLLLKPLRRRDGGLPHAGDRYGLREGSEGYRILADWIEGRRLEGVAPIADAGTPLEAKPGETIRLDGSASRDRRGAPIRYRWRVVGWPEGAAFVLKGAERPDPEFRATREGVYTVELVVTNGETESAPSTTWVEVDARPYVQRECERFASVEGFSITEDPVASGGRLLSPHQSVTPEDPGRARTAFRLPAAGPYRILLRLRGPGDAGALALSVDGGEPWPVRGADGDRFRTVAVGPERIAVPLPGGIERRSGVVAVEGGRLRLLGSPGLPAAVALGEAGRLRLLLEAEPAGGEGDLVVRLGSAGPRGSVLVLRLSRSGRLAFAQEGPGGARRLLEIDGAGAEGPATLELSVAGSRVVVLSGSGEAREFALERPPVGPATIASEGEWSVSRLAFSTEGAAPTPVDLSRPRRPEPWFEAGDHSLEILATSPAAPAVDRVTIVRADLGGSIDERERRTIRALHVDTIGRTPTELELLLAAGLDRERLVDRLVGTLAFWRAWYEDELYYFLLLDNFRPRSPRLEAIPARLANGAIDVVDALREIVISQDFNARNPGNDTFVSVVLEQLLGITVQEEPRILEAGKRMYDGRSATLFGRRGASQSDFVSIVLDHPSFAPFLLSRGYRRIFGEDPPRARLEGWAERLREDARSYPEIVREWLLSEEYERLVDRPRRKSDDVWIRSLFVDLLAREPTYEEWRSFRNALQALSDSTPLRSVLAKVIVDSGRVDFGVDAEGSPRAFVEKWFLRLLGRRPSQEEAEAFAAALGAEGGSPALALYAIVSSDEYQYY